MRIKVGDIVLDQFNNTIIAQNYEVNEFGDLSTRTGGFSNDFTLPLTTKNENALGFPSDLNISTREPYEKVDAQLVDVGAIVAIGYLRYKKIEDKTIKCAFFEGNTEWFNLLKDKKMSELDLSAFNHNWDYSTIGDSIADNKTSGFVYPLIDYGHFVNQALATTTAIDSDQMFPAMFIHTLMTTIFNEIGWTLGGELVSYSANDPYFRMIQPFSAPDFVVTNQFIIDQTIELLENFTIPISNGGTVTTEVGWVGGNNINVGANHQYSVQAFLIGEWDDVTANQILVEIKKDAAILTTRQVGVTIGTNELEIHLTLPETFLTTEDISVQIGINSPGSGTFTVTSGNIAIIPVQEITVNTQITMASTMPDMLQTDFVKYIFFCFGVVPQPDNYSKLLTLDLFKTIEDNIPSALDWSDKLDTSKKTTTDFTKLLNKYSRVSIINYQEDDDDPELSAYKAETEENFGQGQFDINNEHLDPIKEIYTAPYFPMINILSFASGLYIPQIKFFIEDPDIPGTFLKEFEPVPKVAIMSSNISLADLSIQQATTLAITDPDDGGNISNQTNIPFTWFAKTQYIPEVDGFLDSLVFGQIKFPNVIGQPLKDEYLQDYEDVLNEMKFISAFFRLTEVDIINLDFMIPVYVNKYKSYFYRNKIKNYRGSKISTEVELIRIGNG